MSTNKIKDFVIATVIGVPLLLGIGHLTYQESKGMLKDKLKCEELEVGDRGYLRGIVTETRKSRWNWNEEIAFAESNSCSIVIEVSPNDKAIGYFRPGAKLRVAIKMESDYSAKLLNSDVSSDYTIIGLDGSFPETQTTIKTLGNSLMPKRNKEWILMLDRYTNKAARYHFTKDAVNKLEANVKQKWYYHEKEEGRRSFIVSDVETIKE